MKKLSVLYSNLPPQKKRFFVIIAIVALVALSNVGVYLSIKNHYQNLLAQAHPIFVPNTPYAFLRPILGIALPGDQFNSNFPDVRKGIESIVSSQSPEAVTRYSVYFRDLNSGDWTGINENDTYDPASLLKVVVAIAAYKQGESQSGYLSTPLVYTPALSKINTQIPFALPVTLQVGQSYAVPTLIKKELVDSDNGAVYTLLNSLNSQELDEIYEDLSIPKPNDTNSVGYKLTALEYSRFFRILYNGTLDLSWAHSEQILQDLSEATFTDGLVAGVPNTVPVAHKYGEHVNGAAGVATGVELSDCGIVYYPKRPYFLCVMTQGKDTGVLAKVIAQISKYVYGEVDKTKG